MRRPIVFVVFAGLAAMFAALMVYAALKKRDAELAKVKAQTIEIVVAARDLPLGTKIGPEAVQMARWSKDSLPAGAYTDLKPVLNSYAKVGLVANEPVVSSKLFSADKNPGVLPLLIPPGMRAMSVPVDEVSDIAGFVAPHARIDVLATISEGGNGKPFSKVVLENVEVLAVAQQVEKTKDEPQVVKVVTVLVTPQEAEQLALASREGTLRLAMRSYSDHKIVLTSGSDIQTLLRTYSALPAQPARTQRVLASVAPPGPKPFSVEVIRDGKPAESISFINGAEVHQHVRTPARTPASRTAKTHQGQPAEKASAPTDTTSSAAPANTGAREPPTAQPPAASGEEAEHKAAQPNEALAHQEVGLMPASKTISVP